MTSKTLATIALGISLITVPTAAKAFSPQSGDKMADGKMADDKKTDGKMTDGKMTDKKSKSKKKSTSGKMGEGKMDDHKMDGAEKEVKVPSRLGHRRAHGANRPELCRSFEPRRLGGVHFMGAEG